MGDYGVKITKPGLKTDSIDPLDYVVWSKYRHLKITGSKRGKLTIANGSTNETGSLSHALNYEPAFLAYFKYPSQDYWWVVGSDQGTTSSYFGKEYDSTCRSTKELFNIRASRGSDTSGAEDFPYVIYMFDQPAAMGVGGNDKPAEYVTSDYGIKVSQPGIDVKTAKIYEMMINSNCDHLKYHTTYTGSLSYDTTSAGEDTDVIAHSLPYSPLFMVYAKVQPASGYYISVPAGRVPFPFALSGACNEQNTVINLIWAGAGSPSSGTVNYRVVVFKNRLIG